MTTQLQGPLILERFDPVARVTVPSVLTGLQAVARQLGGWTALNRVGWVRASEVRTAQGKYTHPLVVVHGHRRGGYWLALHWTTAGRNLGRCLLLVRVDRLVKS